MNATATKKPAQRRPCRHHWVIETPHGAYSHGICKRCGNEREFKTAADDSVWMNESPLIGAGSQ